MPKPMSNLVVILASQARESRKVVGATVVVPETFLDPRLRRG